MWNFNFKKQKKKENSGDVEEEMLLMLNFLYNLTTTFVDMHNVVSISKIE